jgi:hypothetical protein
MDSDNSFFGIKQFGVDALRHMIKQFEIIKSVTISTPLGPSIEAEEGHVRGIGLPDIQIYKRGRRSFSPIFNFDSA